jgi:outer membrane lipoprotein SlyB
MANSNIYDIAKIISGDPVGGAVEKSKESSAYLEQYKHQKDIIKEINEAIKAAERKAKKKKGAWGLGGSLLGGLLGLAGGVLTGGMGMSIAPWIMGALSSGAGAGIAEKVRQKEYDATAGLEKMEEKYAGRKQIEDPGGVTEIREGVEEGLDKMLLDDILISTVLGGLMPGTEKGLFGKKGAEIITKEGGKGVGKGVGKEVAKKGTTMFGPFGIPMGLGGKGIEYAASPFKDLIPDIAKMFGKDISKQAGTNFASQIAKSSMIPQLIRSFGPGVLGGLQEEDRYQIDPMSGPQFRNPYSKGY